MTDPDIEVSLLLRDLADVGPIPVEVSDRLDETLSRLSAARQVGVAPSRRRRLFVSGTVAASVIAVVGLGIGGMVHALGGSGRSSASAGVYNSANPLDAASSTISPFDELNPSPLQGGGPSTAPGTTPLPAQVKEGALAGKVLEPPTFISSDFAAQARAWWPKAASYTVAPSCSGPWQAGAERALAASLDGRSAALVIFPAQGSTQVVSIYRCASPDVAAGTATLPAQ